MPETPPEPAPQTFEASLTELQKIVNDLEEGNLGLEPSLARFEEGIGLLRSCYRILEEAEQKIEILTGMDAAGNPVSEPFDGAATFEGGTSDAGAKPAKKPGRRRGAAKSDTPASQPPAEPEAGHEPGGLF